MKKTRNTPCECGSMIGDGYKMASHCEFLELDGDEEPDSGPWYCYRGPDLTGMSSGELNDLEQNLREERLRRRKLQEEELASNLKNAVGKFFKLEDNLYDRYFKAKDITEGTLYGNEIKNLRKAQHGWSVDIHYLDLNEFPSWTEMSESDWEDAKKSLIKDAVEDWNNL